MASSFLPHPRNPGQNPRKALVKEALHRELYGLHAERNQLLTEAARRAPDYGPAQWHRGFMREDADWKSVDALIRQADQTPAEKEYELKRAGFKDTIDGHLALANWARDHKLERQERAHLSRVLDLNPEHSVARDRLGFVNVGGEWITRIGVASPSGSSLQRKRLLRIGGARRCWTSDVESCKTTRSDVRRRGRSSNRSTIRT